MKENNVWYYTPWGSHRNLTVEIPSLDDVVESFWSMLSVPTKDGEAGKSNNCMREKIRNPNSNIFIDCPSFIPIFQKEWIIQNLNYFDSQFISYRITSRMMRLVRLETRLFHFGDQFGTICGAGTVILEVYWSDSSIYTEWLTDLSEWICAVEKRLTGISLYRTANDGTRNTKICILNRLIISIEKIVNNNAYHTLYSFISQ